MMVMENGSELSFIDIDEKEVVDFGRYANRELIS